MGAKDEVWLGCPFGRGASARNKDAFCTAKYYFWSAQAYGISKIFAKAVSPSTQMMLGLYRKNIFLYRMLEVT